MNNPTRRANLSSSLRLIFVLLTLLVVVGAADAAPFTVTTINESGTGSLRVAIGQANANPGADTIEFAAGVTGTITLASALPQITGSLTINGPGAGVLTVSGNSSFRVFNIANGVTVSISGLTISNGRVSDFGGGIHNSGTLTVTGSILSANSATSGGGIRNNGTLVVVGSTVSGNSATINGGGIENFGTLTITGSTVSGNSATNGGGGGIHNTAILTITGSTVSGNSATSGNGGGISNSFDPRNVVMLTVTNSTISGNSASASGGGIYNGGTLTITGSTFSGNSATGGGAIDNGGSSTPTATVKNSIIANSPSGGNCSGLPITAVGANFSTDDSCPAFMLVTPEQLKLGPLQANGGPTLTHGLLVGSVAIDAVIDCTDLSDPPVPVATDQRGVNRPFDGDGDGTAWCDAGAFEVSVCASPPQIGSCPANLTQGTHPGQCAAVVTYTIPTAIGCPTPTVTCNPPSGSTFPKGTTTVTCTASNGTPNPPNDTCTFTVTVNDTEPPSITCPAGISQNADSGQCSAVVTYTTPTATDNCPDATVSCAPASGSAFPVGTTTVTCTATDSSGNPDSCSFNVTVADSQPPSITCPANITQGTDTGKCSAEVSYSTPKATDICSSPTVLCDPASGHSFPKGVTTVTCTATDASKNTATCTFTVTVSDTQPPMITCPANVTVSNDPNLCSAVVTYPAPTVSDNCPGVGAPSCEPASGSTFPKGVTTVTCTVTDLSANRASCTFTITVNDTQPPMITCPANVIAVAPRTCPPQTSLVVNYASPVAIDSCGMVTVVCNPSSGSSFPLGTTTVTCTATDMSGNTATCSFTVTVFDGCLQDDANPNTVVLFNTVTGAYRFCCNGTVFTGVGVVTKKGCVVTIQHNPGDRRVLIRTDFAVTAGTASLQFPPGTTKCTIMDRNIINNSCACQ